MEGKFPSTDSGFTPVVESSNSAGEGIITKGSLWLWRTMPTGGNTGSGWWRCWREKGKALPPKALTANSDFAP